MTVWYLPHFILSATCLPVNRRQNALWGACMTTWTYWSTMTVMASCMNIRPLMTWNQTFVEIINDDHQSSQQSKKHVENENAPDFPICSWTSQTIGEVYNFKFSLVRNTGMVAKQWNYWSSGTLVWKPGLKKIHITWNQWLEITQHRWVDLQRMKTVTHFCTTVASQSLHKNTLANIGRKNLLFLICII